MENMKTQFEEIKTLLKDKAQKPYAYSTLLNLQQNCEQESCPNASSLIQSLSESSGIFLSTILVDIFDHDEEIAAQALKCLGFMMYHPTIVASFTGTDVSNMIDSLEKAITTTKNKCVCNLGVWCISIQQLDVLILDMKFESLLRAVVHALDNPFGSLSITFEAMQAVMKLGASLGEKMRSMSYIWTPPIYRRLVIPNKRERDISERCLMKTKSIICPPLSTLSKALSKDMKKNLLSGIKELLNQSMHIQALEAWGWMVCLLDSYLMKDKNLINEMLKIPEQTFSHSDPQVQIASLAAWESLIDVLVRPPAQNSKVHLDREHDIQQILVPKENYKGTEVDKFLKRVNLIMTPIIGIISSKCNVSVHTSCLNTWSYLLHKLDTSVIWDSLVKIVLMPVVEVVFEIGPNNKNIWSWNFCVELLNSYILAEMGNNIYSGLSEIREPLSQNHVNDPVGQGKDAWKHYAIKWSPWGLGQLDFIVKMISRLIHHGSNATVSTEFRKLAYTSGGMLFRSLLKVMQNVLETVSIGYEEILLSLNTILEFLRSTCEDVVIKIDFLTDLDSTPLLLLEAVLENLKPSILESPLYQIALNVKYIRKLEPIDEFTETKVPGIRLIAHTDLVPPVVYVISLYLCQVEQFISNVIENESILNRLEKNVNFLLSSYDPVEILQAFIGILYRKKVFNSLKIWRTIANCVKFQLTCERNQGLLKMHVANSGCDVLLHLLLYPFAEGSFCEIQHVLENVIEGWNLLYASVSHVYSQSPLLKSFSDDLVLMLKEYFNRMKLTIETGSQFYHKEGNFDSGLVRLFGNAVVCVLTSLARSVDSEGRENELGDFNRSRTIQISLEFTARFMMLCQEMEEKGATERLSVTSKLFSTLIQLVHCINLTEDIVLFFKIMSEPLLHWLSLARVKDDISNLFQELWSEVLIALQRSEPQIEFSSSFLRFQEPLLERTLDHPNPTISEPTIAFWNSTYGKQIKLEYPRSLIPLLDKLSRSGKLKLCKRSHPVGAKNHPGLRGLDNSTAVLKRHKVTAPLNICSKIVELAEDVAPYSRGRDHLSSTSKRKRVELTDHQREVRRAQQGRSRDCSGHGPGIHTYTTVDFSQGNEESQDSQEVRDTNSILEMLRKAG